MRGDGSAVADYWVADADLFPCLLELRVESAGWTAPGAAEVDHRVVRLRLRGAGDDTEDEEGAAPPEPPLRRYRITPEVLAALAAPGACTAAQAAVVLAAKAVAESAAALLDLC
jgi:hypothetical protein